MMVLNNKNLLISLYLIMEPRVSQLHIIEAKSVAEYAYHEDKNFPTRKSMEDSIQLLS